MQKKFIFWDWGGVIGDFKIDEFVEDLATVFGVHPSDVSAFLYTAYNNSRIAPIADPTLFVCQHVEIYWTAHHIYNVFANYFRSFPPFDSFVRAFNAALRIDSDHIERFCALSEEIYQAGHMQGLISNANVIHAEKMDRVSRHTYARFENDFIFYSCYYHMRKSPSPEFFDFVFDRVKKQYGILPHDIIFTDDREENLIGCRTAGAYAKEFDGFHRFRSFLQSPEIGVLSA